MKECEWSNVHGDERMMESSNLLSLVLLKSKDRETEHLFSPLGTIMGCTRRI